MEVIRTEIPDVLLIKPAVYRDERGYFFESFHTKRYREAGIPYDFVQDNESKSQKNVLRGLHLQKPPYTQGKLIRVIKGSVFDVVVDVRKNSPHYGRWVSTILTEDNKFMFWVPPGFAHGFLTLSDETIFYYKCTEFYNKESEMSIRWNDPVLAIDWGIEAPVLSGKDREAPLFADFVSPF